MSLSKGSNSSKDGRRGEVTVIVFGIKSAFLNYIITLKYSKKVRIVLAGSNFRLLL